MIILFPDVFWPRKKMKPTWSIGLWGQFLNVSLRAVIHEMLHLSGMHEEDEVRNLTDKHYKTFRRLHLDRFKEEFKPLQRNWRKAQQEFSLLKG